jgi:outer membrane protein OmpU
MKKILLATTLIAASTGYAAAEVAVSGTARMGIISNGDDIEYTSRFRVIFDATGETDGGLTFGASVRNDQSGVGNTVNGDSTVYVSGAYGKLTMGDTGNAADSLVGQVSGVGLTGLSDYNETSWLGRDITGAQYEHTLGALTFAIGLGQTTDTDGNPATDDFMSAAVKYSGSSFTVALGYETNDATDQISALGSATFGAITVKAKVADADFDPDLAYALSLDYAMAATTVTAFYSDNGAHDTFSAFGVGASYDLGGGASLVGGVAKKDDAANETIFDVGVSMSF